VKATGRWPDRLPLLLIGAIFTKQEDDRMTIEQMRNVYDAHPFQPFLIHLADGRHIPVRHREFILPAPSGRTMIVYQPDDSFNIIDLLLVTDLEVGSIAASADTASRS
jgi:hypothetical protein